MRIENIKNIVIEDIPMGKPPPRINMIKVVLGLLAILKIEEDGMLDEIRRWNGAIENEGKRFTRL